MHSRFAFNVWSCWKHKREWVFTRGWKLCFGHHIFCSTQLKQVLSIYYYPLYLLNTRHILLVWILSSLLPHVSKGLCKWFTVIYLPKCYHSVFIFSFLQTLVLQFTASMQLFTKRTITLFLYLQIIHCSTSVSEIRQYFLAMGHQRFLFLCVCLFCSLTCSTV